MLKRDWLRLTRLLRRRLRIGRKRRRKEIIARLIWYLEKRKKRI